jgi:hypothetical protein
MLWVAASGKYGCPRVFEHQNPFGMNPFFFGVICESIDDSCYFFEMKLVHRIFRMESRRLSKKGKSCHVRLKIHYSDDRRKVFGCILAVQEP